MKSIANKEKKARLFIVSTPIGNLDDISKRGIDTLQLVDYILSEDTRITGKLLSHYGITSKMLVYNEQSKENDRLKTLEYLKNGKNIALVSDSGTPLISDPGYKLIKLLIENEINVIPIPGASSILAALIVSGMPTDQFTFLGFLHNKLKTLELLKYYKGSIIIFSTFNKLKKDIENIYNILGDRECSIARELTKIHESVISASLSNIESKLSNDERKGEIVLIIRGYLDNIENENYKDIILDELKKGSSIKEIAEIISSQSKVKKTYIYKLALEIKNNIK